MNCRRAGATVAVFMCLSGSALAERPWWKFWESRSERAAEVTVEAVIQPQGFSREQQSLLRDFLAGEQRRQQDRPPGKAKPLPPGLQKKLARGGELPPGWQKKLARGEVIDPQVWALSSPLPPGIQRQLGPVPPGTEIRYLDDQAYRVMRDTMVIIDILGL